MLPGVYNAIKKDGKGYYRASITFMGKHISLGSYEIESDANSSYLNAQEILSDISINIDAYPSYCIIPFSKWIVLHNFRDNHIYFKNPIYLKQKYFLYYINPRIQLKFDADDLFYYAHHKILKRGNHLFVSDYGMQVNILSRYGIKNYAVPGRDYIFTNGDCTDYRYGNIKIINQYYGVTRIIEKGNPFYLTKIHINGNYQIGCYSTEIEAAIAYNKAVKQLLDIGLNKNYPQNFIDGIDEISYASLYQKIKISKKYLEYIQTLKS